MHKAIKLADGELVINERDKDGTWDLNLFQKLTKPISDGTELKRKISRLNVTCESTDGINSKNNYKKTKSAPALFQNLNILPPLGLIWDSKDYSCAYDSLFTVFFHIWNEGQIKHSAYFENGVQMMRILHSKFSSLLNKSCTFETIRDHIREKLNHEKPMQYCYGSNYTDIDELVRDLMLTGSYGTSYFQCLNCKFSISDPYTYLNDYTAVGWSSLDKNALQNKASIQSYLNFKISKEKEMSRKTCPECFKFNKNSPLYVTQYINDLPTILIFALASWCN